MNIVEPEGKNVQLEEIINQDHIQLEIGNSSPVHYTQDEILSMMITDTLTSKAGFVHMSGWAGVPGLFETYGRC